MNHVIKRTVFDLVQFIFNNYVSEEHKNLLIFKYSKMNDFDEIINELIIDLYRTYSKDKLKLDFYLKHVSKLYLNNVDVSLIKEDILSRLESNIECGNYSLEENHRLIDKSLYFICSELNKRNVDYYVVGSLPIYIKVGKGFCRFHSDVDIAINSKDIDCLEDIFKDSEYVFLDKRLCSQKFFDYNEKRARGGHEIIAQCKDSDFSIGFYEFDRVDNDSIVKKDYFSEVVEGNLINRVCKYVYSKEFVDLYYSQDKISYNGVEFRYCKVEGLYLLKKKNYVNVGRNKDMYDVNFIEENCDFDKEKVMRMKELIVEYASYIIEEVNK